MLEEELKGNQHKIDANKNNKVDAHDFKLLRAQKEKEKANSMKFGKGVKEEVEELIESHFKVGDEVICKASGMEGEVIKVDPKGEGKYYTVKQENGTIKKFAPNELKKEEGDEDEEDDEDEKENMKEAAGASKSQETKFHKKLDTLVHNTFGKRKEEMKEENIDEAMFPGTKEYEKKYGQSPQQKLKKKGDTVPTSQGTMTKTEKGVSHTRRFTEMVQTYKQGGLKTIAEMLVKEEPDNEQFTKEVEEQKKRDKGEIRNDKGVAKSFQSASVREDPVNPVREDVEETEIAVINADAANGVEMVDIAEREMSDAEMKKGMAGFKQRYGDRAKQVMYATATKTAMKD
jgi:hypothetical protein